MPWSAHGSGIGGIGWVVAALFSAQTVLAQPADAPLNDEDMPLEDMPLEADAMPLEADSEMPDWGEPAEPVDPAADSDLGELFGHFGFELRMFPLRPSSSLQPRYTSGSLVFKPGYSLDLGESTTVSGIGFVRLDQHDTQLALAGAEDRQGTGERLKNHRIGLEPRLADAAEDVVARGGGAGDDVHLDLKAVAEELSAKWASGKTRIHFIPEFYDYPGTYKWADETFGWVEEVEGIHDDPTISTIMMTVDPNLVRIKERVAKGKASINGISLVPVEKAVEAGRKIVDHRAEVTAAAIRKAIE